MIRLSDTSLLLSLMNSLRLSTSLRVKSSIHAHMPPLSFPEEARKGMECSSGKERTCRYFVMGDWILYHTLVGWRTKILLLECMKHLRSYEVMLFYVMN